MNNKVTVLAPVALALICTFWSVTTHSAAWTLPRGTGEAIVTMTYYTVNQRFDLNGDRVPQPRFTKLDTEAFAQFGVTDKVTAGVNLRLQHLTSDSSGGTVSSTGIGETDIFVRRQLIQLLNTVVSIQGLIKTPELTGSANPALGFGQTDLELRLLAGNSGNLGIGTYFVDAEGALRKRFGDPADEFRMDATIGVRPLSKWMFMLQSFNTVGLGNANGTAVVQTSGLDAQRYQLQLSAVWELAPILSLQAGVLRDIAGVDSGAGTAVVAGVWLRF